jgi:hypothetical protein
MLGRTFLIECCPVLRGWQKMAECEPTGNETRAAFIARLKKCARALPRAVVRATVRRMKSNLGALIESKGFTPKND